MESLRCTNVKPSMCGLRRAPICSGFRMIPSVARPGSSCQLQVTLARARLRLTYQLHVQSTSDKKPIEWDTDNCVGF